MLTDYVRQILSLGMFKKFYQILKYIWFYVFRVGALACYSVKIRVIFGSSFKDEKLIKKQTYMYVHENWNMQTLF